MKHEYLHRSGCCTWWTFGLTLAMFLSATNGASMFRGTPHPPPPESVRMGRSESTAGGRPLPFIPACVAFQGHRVKQDARLDPAHLFGPKSKRIKQKPKGEGRGGRLSLPPSIALCSSSAGGIAASARPEKELRTNVPRAMDLPNATYLVQQWKRLKRSSRLQ